MEPKYKIGQKVYATWASGRVTSHIIRSVKNTDRGFWYTFYDEDNFEIGLHEKYLSLYK